MNTERMELTNFHLGRRQKQALKARAKANGSNVAEEIRSAIDAYLSGVTAEELALLDAATRQAADAISEMSAMLAETNRNADRVFSELEKLRGSHPSESWTNGTAKGIVRKSRGRTRGKIGGTTA